MEYFSNVKNIKWNVLFTIPIVMICIFGFKTKNANQNQEFDLKSSITRGKALYQANCTTCHMANGQGISSVFPPLVQTDNIQNKGYLVNVVKNGISGTLKVNNITYESTMEGTTLNDKEISDVLNYIRNSWGNKQIAITPNEVSEFLKQNEK